MEGFTLFFRLFLAEYLCFIDMKLNFCKRTSSLSDYDFRYIHLDYSP